MATNVQILYWHDIPLQVRARGDGGRVGVQLASRFQEAVDQAAMATGLIGSDDYSAAFRWSAPQPYAGSPQDAVAAVVARIEAQFPVVDWRATVAAVRAASGDGKSRTES